MMSKTAEFSEFPFLQLLSIQMNDLKTCHETASAEANCNNGWLSPGKMAGLGSQEFRLEANEIRGLVFGTAGKPALPCAGAASWNFQA